MFRSIYESPWYHPLLCWVASAALLLFVARRLPFLYAFLVAFVLAILADATLTGPWSPVSPGGAAAAALGLVFVILGDARYFLLVERARAGRLSGRAAAIAFGFSLIVPGASFVVRQASPRLFADMRVVFFAYEGLFVVLAVGLRAWLPQRLRDATAGERAWALRATEFEIAQYALWALADALILAGLDVGFALRLIPNTMYYALFLPFVAWTAPRASHEPWHAATA